MKRKNNIKKSEKELLLRTLSLLLCVMLTAGMAVPAAAVSALPGDTVAAEQAEDTAKDADSFGGETVDEEDTFGEPDTNVQQDQDADGQPALTDADDAWENAGDESGESGAYQEQDEFASETEKSVSAEAAGAADTDTAAETKKKTTVALARKVVMNGMTFVFNRQVIKNKHFGATRTPQNLYVKGYKSKITAAWKAPELEVEGYYVFRQNSEGTEWNEIADLPAETTSYKDAAAKYADNVYTYRIIAYHNTSKGIKVSLPSDWASAVTTRSKKVNVYSVTNKNHAKTAALSIGKKVKVGLKFPKNYLSKEMRWSTGDANIATIDANGKITGVGHGKTMVYCKMHTGNVYSFKIAIVEPGTAQGMVEVMQAWMDYSTLNGKHKGIIDIYNTQDPLPVNYKMKYSDAWCDATVTAAAVVSCNLKYVGGECSVPRHINIFKNKKAWEEDGTIKPKAGDLIIYSWSKSYQPNNNSASHIGIVESVKKGQITTIEGNMGSGVVGRRVIKVGYGYIRGFGRPKYKKSTAQ